jgi:hypothetical protein
MLDLATGQYVAAGGAIYPAFYEEENMDNELKYIIVGKHCTEMPIIFSAIFNHSELIDRNQHTIISAGICHIYCDDDKLQFTSRMGSVTLGIEFETKRNQIDYDLLKSRLFSSIY